MTVLDSFRLDGRRVLITGAGRGLGAAASHALSAAGATVVLTGRDRERLTEIEAQIRSNGGIADSVVMDVSDAASIADGFTTATRRAPVDALINNAGIAGQGRLVDMSTDDLQHVLDTNLSGALLCARAFAQHRSHGGGGVIINIASIASEVGVSGQVAYSASKGGITAMTRSLALELAPHHIRVNALAPGYFTTDMPKQLLGDAESRARLTRRIPLRRIASTAEIGPPIVFMCSDAAAYMTGATLYFDGGYTSQ